jgi:hypothetical protein
MRPSGVQLVDLGLDWSFDQSIAFVHSLIQSINVDWEHPAAEVQFIRTRDLDTVAAALAAANDITHVMAHSIKEEDGEVAFVSDDGQTQMGLTDLARSLQDRRSPLASDVLFADCCDSAGTVFRRAVREIIGQPILYLAAKGAIDWHDSTTFGSLFYAAYFRRKGKGVDPLTRAEDAAKRAVASYGQLLERQSPYTHVRLTPSRQATRAFG